LAGNTEDAARAYYTEVCAHAQNARPGPEMLLRLLRRRPGEKPTPKEMAKSLFPQIGQPSTAKVNAAGTKQSDGTASKMEVRIATSASKPIQVKNPKMGVKATAKEATATGRERSKRGRGTTGRSASSYPQMDGLPTVSPIMAHDPRKYTEDLDKCPHGIPQAWPCARCR
jgi:hypothetical protein